MDEQQSTIAGYPLVRALRADADRERWVAADADGGGVELHRARAGGSEMLAAEVAAVMAAGHAHILPIIDVAVDDGPVVVRPLVTRTLSEWLLHRHTPAPGEAVTALAPVAAALAALHAIGAAAGGLADDAVRLDDDGAPMLVAEGAAQEVRRPTEAWRQASEGVGADVEGWRIVATGVLGAAGVALPDEVDVALERQDLAAAGAALLAAWPALPLELDAVASATRTALPTRPRVRAAGPAAVLSRVAALAERIADLGGPRLAQFLAVTATVRPRFWAIAGGGASALVAAAVMLTQAGAAGAGAAGDAAGDAAGGAAAPSVAAPSGPAGSPTTPGVADGPAPDDDPVAAVARLLAEREGCLDAADAGCLVVLHDPGSPLLADDSPWRMPDDGRLEVVEQLGDAWLLRVVSKREPASVLAMSTEAGWMLRDAWSDASASP